MIRFTPSGKELPQAGSILLAEPFLEDPYFGRKAILLCEHNSQGSFGFVLNNFVDIALGDLMEGWPEMSHRISVGGPVKNTNLYYLHTHPEIEGSIPIVEGICMGGDFEKIRKNVEEGKIPPDDLRFFIGYAGWSANQLLEEIQSHSWFVTQTPGYRIMDTAFEEEDLWRQLISDMGDAYAHIANAPSNPSLN